MSLRKKTNSTEELLEIIRDSGGGKSAVGGGSESSDSKADGLIKPRGKKARKGILFGFRRKSVVGVEIGESVIDLVKIVSRDSRNRTVAAHRVHIPDGTKPGSDKFIDLLQSAVTRMAGRDGNTEIWSLIRSADVDVGPVLIPKVSTNKIADTVYWTIKKDKKFDEKDYVFDIRPHGVVKDEGVAKIEVLTGTVRRESIDRLQGWFAQAGFELAGITTVPNAFQNAYATGNAPEENGLVAQIHVDAGFSTITILHGERILFSRSIKSGLDSMAEDFARHVQESGGATAPSIAEARRLLTARFQGLQPESGAPGAGIPDEEVFEIVTPPLQRLTRQVDRTLEYYFNNFKQRCDVLHLSGDLFINERVAEYMSAQLGLPTRTLRLLGESARMEDSDPNDRIVFNSATALALSDPNRTINLLVNHAKRASNLMWQRLNNGVAVAGLILALVVGGLFGWQKMEENSKTARLKKLTDQYAAIEPKVTEVKLAKIASAIVKDHKQLKELCKRYCTLAILGELTRLTPETVRFLSVSIDRGQGAGPLLTTGDDPAQAKPTVPGVVVLDGLVLQSPEDFNTVLSKFLISLEASPIFDRFQILSSEVTELSTEGEVLHFVLHVSWV